jgi:uncharacterized protein (TIGR02271 family)
MAANDEIVVLFDNVTQARNAERALEAAGFPDPDVNTLDRKSLMALAGRAELGPGFWRRLFGRELRQHEGEVFEHALAKGGGVLTVRVHNEGEARRAQGLLDSLHIVDVDRRAQGILEERLKEKKRTSAADDDIIRLVEEALSVGKRRIETGRTRVRRYIVERPVEEEVTLKSEQAEIIRKVVENPALLTDIDWSDKTIEVIETDEEAVISKTARVAEEVRVRKGEAARTETVRDTVRKQHVDVERIPGERRPTK